MNVVLFVSLPVAGIVLGWIIRWLYAKFQLSSAEQKAERVKQDALKEAEAQKKEYLLETITDSELVKKLGEELRKMIVK